MHSGRLGEGVCAKGACDERRRVRRCLKGISWLNNLHEGSDGVDESSAEASVFVRRPFNQMSNGKTAVVDGTPAFSTRRHRQWHINEINSSLKVCAGCP